MFGAEEQFNLSIGVMSMYDTDGQLLREAWKASAQQQCPHANFALERSCGGILTGYSLCRTCGMRGTLLSSGSQEKKAVPSAWSQRRSSPRLNTNGPIVLERATFNGEGHLLNVSVPGCGVQSQMSVAVGEHLGLHLFLFNDEAAIWVPRAIVRWQGEVRFGLEFLSWEDADRQRLSRFIATRITAAA
jgi:hypothetical protein